MWCPHPWLKTYFPLSLVKADVHRAPAAGCRWQQNSSLEERCSEAENKAVSCSPQQQVERIPGSAFTACLYPLTAKETQSLGWGRTLILLWLWANGKLPPSKWWSYAMPSHLQLSFSSYQIQSVLTDHGNVNWFTITNVTGRNFPVIPKNPTKIIFLLRILHIYCCFFNPDT